MWRKFGVKTKSNLSGLTKNFADLCIDSQSVLIHENPWPNEFDVHGHHPFMMAGTHA
jgi:hypothetical protein